MQNSISQLRAHALRDLERFYPSNHYWMRPYSIEADFEITDPLLRQPESFRLTARELAAATAFHNMTFAEIRRRKIYGDAHPARDVGDDSPSPGVSESQKMEIVARHAIFMASALSYSRLIGEPSLIDAFTPQVPAVEPSQNEVLAAATGKSSAETAIPGKPPTKGAGQVAIKVAWRLECESLGQRPTAAEIMTRLRELANNGKEYTDVLRQTPATTQGVNWITKKGKSANYSAEALESALTRWWNSRQ